MKPILLMIGSGLALYLMYQAYLVYPQRFEVNQCIKNSRINEIYRINGPAYRDISFKGRWFFGPMVIGVQVEKPNPNTTRSKGDKMIFEQDDSDLSEIACP